MNIEPERKNLDHVRIQEARDEFVNHLRLPQKILRQPVVALVTFETNGKPLHTRGRGVWLSNSYTEHLSMLHVLFPAWIGILDVIHWAEYSLLVKN